MKVKKVEQGYFWKERSGTKEIKESKGKIGLRQGSNMKERGEH